jgi:hypothetical protein
MLLFSAIHERVRMIPNAHMDGVIFSQPNVI